MHPPASGSCPGGRPLDADTIELLDSTAERIDAERGARVNAHLELTSTLREMRHRWRQATEAQADQGVVDALRADIEAERARVATLQAGLAVRQGVWRAFNSGPEGRPGGVVAAPQFAQQLLEELTAAAGEESTVDSSPAFERFSYRNVEQVDKVDDMLRDLAPGLADNSVARVIARRKTWIGGPSAAQVRTFDGYANGHVHASLAVGEPTADPSPPGAAPQVRSVQPATPYR